MLGFILCLPWEALSQVTLTVEDGSGAPGSSGGEVAVSLENPDDKVSALQFDICDEDDYLTVSKVETTLRTDGFAGSVNELTNGCGRITLFSWGLDLIQKGEGPILIIKYNIASNAPLGACRAFNLKNIKVTDQGIILWKQR